ncbi:MAG TPA: heme exporter protein CcmD [Dongiaceae bacterium]|jgi:hypothetical protein|nr:heme exporter protein CcmD [Dongiaceae bacterium]
MNALLHMPYAEFIWPVYGAGIVVLGVMGVLARLDLRRAQRRRRDET